MAKARRAKSKHAAEKPRRSERINNNERVNEEKPRKHGGSIIGKFMLVMLLLSFIFIFM